MAKYTLGLYDFPNEIIVSDYIFSLKLCQKFIVQGVRNLYNWNIINRGERCIISISISFPGVKKQKLAEGNHKAKFTHGRKRGTFTKFSGNLYQD